MLFLYDPTVGRFLNADGIVGANGGIEGYNMFAYCNNSPVSNVDIKGNEKTSIAGEYKFEYGTVSVNLRAQGTNAREMSNAIKVGKQNITITLPNGIKLTIHINKGNVFV